MSLETTEKKCIPSIVVILACIGLITTTFIVSTGLGYFRVHIENLKTRSVWIFNAPSEENISMTPESVKCLRSGECELLEDGSTKLSSSVDREIRKQAYKK